MIRLELIDLAMHASTHRGWLQLVDLRVHRMKAVAAMFYPCTRAQA
jgi:hypothetical protein